MIMLVCHPHGAMHNKTIQWSSTRIQGAVRSGSTLLLPPRILHQLRIQIYLPLWNRMQVMLFGGVGFAGFVQISDHSFGPDQVKPALKFEHQFQAAFQINGFAECVFGQT
jgi:hypothetical protein